MKVLWFSPSPGLSDALLNDNYSSAGWIKSLEKSIQQKVELSIAFFHDKQIEPFTLAETRYYPVKRYKYGKLSKSARRLFNRMKAGKKIATRFLLF